ncbi:PEP-CTERM sorting domain-containing protein [Ideonella sp.]|uniref:PEP-CTERM sorting domain-containing protein n=1 Tax=Ideonella sp. TaxID=1929293 RepID=UPI0035AE57AB
MTAHRRLAACLLSAALGGVAAVPATAGGTATASPGPVGRGAVAMAPAGHDTAATGGGITTPTTAPAGSRGDAATASALGLDEPSAYAMCLAGLAVLAMAALRRRQRR